MAASVEESRTKANVTEHHIENTAHTIYPGNYHGYSDEWDLEKFKKDFRVVFVNYYRGRELEMDLIGISPAVANAYRRIMIAEVPTMAIEHVFIYNNTSVIQDEMLSHRMGMIPIRADPTKFQWKPAELSPDEIANTHTIRFRLEAKCEKLPDVDPDSSGRREDLYKDYKVLSGHLVWDRLPNQENVIGAKTVICPVQKKILIAKLSGKQEIDLKLHAVKGIGRDHIKFSPVATATYRLLPEIILKSKIIGDAALRLKHSFSDGVIELVGREKEAKVVNARIDSGSRNVFRHADLKDKVEYNLIKDHFIFNIESTGCLPALDIMLQSSLILESKCEYFLKELQACRFRINELASMIESV